MPLELKLPEGAPFTADILPSFVAEAEALGLNQETAQKLVDYRAKNTPKPPEKYDLKLPDKHGLHVDDVTAIGAEAKALGLSPAQAQKLADARIAAAQGRRPPDKYELKAPEGSPLAANDLEAIAAEAKALGLPQAAAQQLVETRAKLAGETATRFLTELKADTELGGDKFDASVVLAKKGLDYLFPPGAAETGIVMGLLNRTGLGNHKALVRAFARLGKEVADDTHVGGGAGGGGGEALPLHERLYPKMRTAAS